MAAFILCAPCLVLCVALGLGRLQAVAIKPSDIFDNDGTDDRVKREIWTLRRAAFNALKRIVSDALKTPPGPSVGNSRYVKWGGLKEAERDFFSISLKNVRTPVAGPYTKQGRVIFGRIGDHRVRLIEKGTKQGDPVLEFIDPKGQGNHKIVYLTKPTA